MATNSVRSVWAENETRKLIELWGDEHIQSQIQDFSVRNNVVHTKLSEKMKECGFSRSAKQIDTKLKHLREVYRKYKDKINRSGAGGGKPPKYFEEIDLILGTRPQTQPTFLIDSGNINSYSFNSSSNSSDGLPQGDGEEEMDEDELGSNDSNFGDQEDIVNDQLPSSNMLKTKARAPRHKKSKIEEALGSFKEFLTEQNNKQYEMSQEMHKQWLEMEKMKLQQEQENRERERVHEMRLMEMFTTMIHRTQPPPSLNERYAPASEGESSTAYTELRNAPESNNYFSPFNFR